MTELKRLTDYLVLVRMWTTHISEVVKDRTIVWQLLIKLNMHLANLGILCIYLRKTKT